MQRNAIFLDEQNILQGFSSPPAGKSFSESSETFLPSGKYFPNLRKPSCHQKNTFRVFGNLPATKKYFPDLRKPSCRRENTFRIFGNLPAVGKILSESSGTFSPPRNRFPVKKNILS